VVWLPETKQARGEKEIRSAFEGLLSANTVKVVVLSDTGYRTMGKVSVGWGRVSLTLAPKAGGSPVVMTGRYTDIVERRGGRWVYIVDHASAEPAGTEGSKK
jgi:ketosteroid isomerase-like protein